MSQVEWFSSLRTTRATGSDRLERAAERQQLMQADHGAGLWEAATDAANYFVIDMETSGFDAANDLILSIAVLCMDGDAERGTEWYRIVQQDDVAAVPEAIWRLTGLTAAQVQAGEPWPQVFREALSLCVGRVWVAHHARHELSFLHRQARRLWRMQLRPVVIDTSVVARALFGLSQSPTLEAVCDSFGIPTADRHRADADVRMTAAIWRREMDCCRQLGLHSVRDVLEWAWARGTG